MSVSSSVDLTHNRDFKDEIPLKHLNIKSRENTLGYRRYHRLKDKGTNTISALRASSVNFYDFGTDTSFTLSTTSLDTYFDNILNDVVLVEERVCWRELVDDPEVFAQSYNQEEYEERYKNRNFTLGSKYDRQKVHYEMLREAELDRSDECDCCGKRFNLNNCLSHYYGLCLGCNARLEENIQSIRL